jgi:MarR family transcriptional regulator, organic hydroperoxide resistance regulator
MVDLRFGGSVWCNLDIALRNIDEIYKKEVQALNLSVIEWYILRELYEEDGQMASHLAKGVGRPATSFTPILDQLEHKGLIERRMHPSDRRSVLMYLTSKGKALRQQVQNMAERIEEKLSKRISDKDWQSYEHVLANFQILAPENGNGTS